MECCDHHHTLDSSSTSAQKSFGQQKNLSPIATINSWFVVFPPTGREFLPVGGRRQLVCSISASCQSAGGGSQPLPRPGPTVVKLKLVIESLQSGARALLLESAGVVEYAPEGSLMKIKRQQSTLIQISCSYYHSVS
jgi:hypothetical protein